MRQSRRGAGLMLIGVLATVTGRDARAAAALLPDGVLANVSPSVSTFSTLTEYKADGTPVQSFTITYPGSNEGTEYPRGVAVGPGGNVQIYNGTFTGYLTTLVPATGAKSSHKGVGFSTVNGSTLGGVAALGDYAFVTDMQTEGSLLAGLVRFDLRDFSSQRFGSSVGYVRVVAGADGLVYGVRADSLSDGPSVDVFDPVTLAPVRGLVLHFAADAFAVAADGDFYAVSGKTAARLSPAGDVLNSAKVVLSGVGPTNVLNDVSLSSSGQLVMGTMGGSVVVTDTSFDTPTQFKVGTLYDVVFVSSTSPASVPEPPVAGLTAIVMAAATTVRRPRRRDR